MEEIILNLLRDLPSTGLFVLFIFMINKQFRQALNMLTAHLDQLNGLIASCLKSKDMDEKERALDRKIARMEGLLSQAKEYSESR